MYKVVIIDDEPVIVKGITKVVPWAKFDCEVVATAEDGLDGLRVMAQYRPDIVITDIAMPGMDGLKMIAAIRSEYPDTVVSILTGYRDFDFAQQAIRLGVTRFLLKPSNMDELEEAVSAMCQRLGRIKSIPVVEAPEPEAKTPEEEPAHEAGSFIVKNAVDFMEKNYVCKLTLADVADKCYVSQWHLSKLLNKHLNQNFSEILNGIRIKEAKKLLADPSLRIGEVAEMVGFIDMAHFSRVFKKLEGVSANEYRNKL